jgi:hypothetical protein
MARFFLGISIYEMHFRSFKICTCDSVRKEFRHFYEIDIFSQREFPCLCLQDLDPRGHILRFN